MMATDNIGIWKVADGRRSSISDHVIRETEVTIKLNGRKYRRLYCLGSHLEELALGYFFTEGLATHSDINKNVKGSEISIYRSAQVKKPRAKNITSRISITEQQVFDWVDTLNESCPLFKKTGGTHVVGIFGGQRPLIIEDTSRHCAIDKVIGLAVKNEVELSQGVLVTSCRQTASTMGKAINAGIPIVVTISAPTSLAVEQAQRLGVTLVGFARGRQFNIYANEWRISGNAR
jgi:FdhD protein